MEVPLAILPNQSRSFVADSSFWEIHIFQAVSTMYVDIKVNGEELIAAGRCVGGELLLPYDYMWMSSKGNLIFNSEPDWEKFGITCNLIYLTNAEAKEWKELAGV